MSMANSNMKPKWSLNDPIWLVRIDVSMQNYTRLTDKVVYYRCRMTYDYLCRWLWYFEYLQARVKVAHPHRVVSLMIGRTDPKILLGQDFIDHRRAVLIKSRTRKLNDLVNTPFDDDLFGYKSQEVNERISRLKNEIEALERGEVTFPVIPDFVNEIKQWI